MHMHTYLHTRTIAGTIAGLALLVAPLAHAQQMAMPQGFFQSIFTMSGTSTMELGLGQSITCVVFGILNDLGILRTVSGCSPSTPGGGGGNGGGTGTTTPGTLTVYALPSGGSATSSSFMLHVSGGNAQPSSFQGSSTGTSVRIDANASYSVSADAMSQYSPSYGDGCSGTMPSGGTRSCTVTEMYTGTSTGTTTPGGGGGGGGTGTSTASTTPTGMITVIKHVMGGGASSTEFMLHLHKVTGATTSNPTMTEVGGSPQMGSATGTMYADLPPGTYHVEESGGPSGFAHSYSGDCGSDGMINLTASSSKTCTLTNTRELGSIEVKKIVSHGNASSTDSATSSDFQIHLWRWDDSSASSSASSTEVTGSPKAGSAMGVMFSGLPFGKYRITETGASSSSYTPSWSGSCDSSGMLMLDASTTKSCTITNTFMSTSTGTST